MGRILAVADLFDALTSLRPYKNAWPVDDAVDEIMRTSGSHFDPRIAGLFSDVIPALTDVQYQFRDTHCSSVQGA